MKKFKRKEILSKFKKMIEKKIPIIGGGAGTGISARFEEEGGIDLIVIYNSGKYRMAGRGSLAGLLAFGNANDIVIEMAKEVIPVVKNTPVLAGVNGTDPFAVWDDFFNKLDILGFSGIQNFPTVGLIDGIFRENLEETGMGYAREIELIELAHKKDFFTTPYVFSLDDVRNMVKAGADVIVCHMGLTTSGSIGSKTFKTLNGSAGIINEWSELAKTLRDDIIVLCHGGPIATPEDAQFIFNNCKLVNGFYGASSLERLPVELAIKQQTIAFKSLKFLDN